MNVSTKYSCGSLSIFLEGELDHHCAKAAMDRIDREIENYLPRELVIDMGRLSFMDSSGIALVIKANRKLAHCGGRMYIENPQQQPLRVLDASGIDRLIAIRETGEVIT